MGGAAGSAEAGSWQWGLWWRRAGAARSAGRWRRGGYEPRLGSAPRRKAEIRRRGPAASRVGSEPGRPGATPRPSRPAEGAPGRGGAGRKRRHRTVAFASIAGGRRCAPGQQPTGAEVPLPLATFRPPPAASQGRRPARRWPDAWMAWLPAPPDHRSPAAGRYAEALARRSPGSLQVSLAAQPPPGRLLRRCPEPRSSERRRPPSPGLGAEQDAPSEAPPPQRGPRRAAPSLAPLPSRGRKTGGSLLRARLFSCRRLALRSPRPPDRRAPLSPARHPCPALDL